MLIGLQWKREHLVVRGTVEDLAASARHVATAAPSCRSWWLHCTWKSVVNSKDHPMHLANHISVASRQRQPLQESHDRSPDLRLPNFGDPGQNDKAGSGQDLSKSAEMSRQVSHLPPNHGTHRGTEICGKKSVNGQSANYIYLRGSFSDLQAKPLSPSTYLTVLQSFGYF